MDMFPKRKFYTRWWGPLVGALVGAEFAMKNGNFRDDPGHFLMMMALGVGTGTAAGILIMFLDPPLTNQVDPFQDTSRETSKPTLAGNILCALSMLFFFMPLFNIVLAALALACNWKVRGWVKPISWFALMVAIVYTYIFVRLSMYYYPGEW